MHRVRPLPGRLPGVRHRQDALPEARDHGAARPGARPGRRDAARPRRGPRGDDLGLRDLRRLRAGVPGLDRAHRPHRRPAPPPGDGRVELPGRGRADAARRRARVEPVGQGAVRARRLGGRARRQGARARRPRPRVPVLGGMRVVVRRARAQDRRGDREAAAERGRRLRDPRPARELHRRPRAPDGQRVRVPGVRRAERRDAQRGRRHARSSPAARTASTRSPTSTRTSAAATRSSTTPSCSSKLVRDGRLKPAKRRRRPRSPTTTPATSRATTTCSRRRASSSPPSGRPSR